ncbi:CheR family methyltransferase, partial [Rhizobium ruizarguesonis]
ARQRIFSARQDLVGSLSLIYCDLVASQAGAAPRREMLSHLNTNFTRFFRENHHFDHLRDNVLPELLQRARSGGRVRIWSAASYDGQEPY